MGMESIPTGIATTVKPNRTKSPPLSGGLLVTSALSCLRQAGTSYKVSIKFKR